MNYDRVIPRDLFNEALLLKWIGKITLYIHDKVIKGLNFNHENSEAGFIILQDNSSGDIYISNLYFYDNNGTPVLFKKRLNTKGSWDLLMEYKQEEYWPFNNNGDYQLDKNLFR